jgi:TatD DNase family protein
MKIYDSHTHINSDPLFHDWQWYLQKFIDEWWIGLVNSWASEEYNLRGLEISKLVENLKLKAESWWSDFVIRSTIGYHPGCCDDGEITEENIQQKIIDLKKLYETNKAYIVAIGECGIDTYYPGTDSSLPLQKKLFVFQCELARELNVPLMIHIRKDFETAFEILQHYTDVTVYIHCRWFGPEEIKRLKDLQIKRLFIWFCGNVTYKNAQLLRDSLVIVPLDHLLLETDAPWLSPQVVRWTTNTPANVKYIYEFVADLLSIEKDVLADQIEKNFKNLYSFK